MLSSKADSVRLYKTRKLISELQSKEGRGTELVSLYIPPKKPIHEVIAYLRNEWGTAGNIKSDTTRNHVQDALTKTMQRLKLYRETPENGLVIFAGALPTNGPGSEVVRLNEIVPPKPVHAFVYTCVAPDTRILLDDGTEKSIGALKGSWTNEKVMSWSEERRRLVGNSIQDYLNIPVGGRKTYRLTVESGRSILATEDHPFRTPRGWVRLGELRKGDIVCVLPLADIGSIRSTENKEKVIMDEETIRKISHPPKNMSLVIRRLRERGLLPLTSQNPKLILIARMLGHLFSDGSMVHTIEERSSGGYSYFTFDLCIGSKTDEDELRNDLAKLGYELPEGCEVTYTMNVEGREYTACTRHAKLRNVAICTLLRVLGAPMGDKVKNGTKIPAWLMESPLTVQREFLAAYLGGDGIMPRMVGRNLASRSGVEFHRIMQRKKSDLMFANQLESLLSNFGVIVNAIEQEAGYRRKDGFDTIGIWLPFKLTEENILKLSHDIGIRYCSRKAIGISRLGEYLRIKFYLREENRRKMMQVRQLSADGMEANEIGKLLLVTNRRASQWAQGNVQSPVIKSAQLASFDEWSRTARTDLEEPLLWESVVSIESEAISEVRDLTVSDSSHSFFANGFLVHNCDDHFHVEQLRDMLREDKIYGILAIDSSEVGMGILSGDSLEVVDTMTSGISGKTRKGGQSARRYERAREMELTYFFNRVGEHATRNFVNSNKVKGLIIGGPGPTKDDFIKGGYLHYQLQQNIIEVIDTGYSGREGVREIVEKASDVLQDVRFVEEKKLVQRFLAEVNKPNGLAIYGLPRVMVALDKANVEVVLVSDDVNMTKIRMTCRNCKTPKEEVIPNQKKMQTMQEMISTPCTKCGATDYDVEEMDIVDLLEEKAIQIGAKVEVISGGTEEGAMFKSFGGIAAFVRYRA